MKQIFPNFRLLAKSKFGKATTQQGFTQYYIFVGVVKQVNTTMPQAFEQDFPNFWLLAKIKFVNATTQQGITRYYKLARIVQQVKNSMQQVFETILLKFLAPCKN